MIQGIWPDKNWLCTYAKMYMAKMFIDMFTIKDGFSCCEFISQQTPWIQYWLFYSLSVSLGSAWVMVSYLSRFVTDFLKPTIKVLNFFQGQCTSQILGGPNLSVQKTWALQIVSSIATKRKSLLVTVNPMATLAVPEVFINLAFEDTGQNNFYWAFICSGCKLGVKAYYTNYTFVGKRTIEKEYITPGKSTHGSVWRWNLNPWNSPGSAKTFGEGCGVGGGNPCKFFLFW